METYDPAGPHGALMEATKPSNAPGGPVAWVLTREDLMHMLEAIRTSACVVMDLETTGLDEHAVTGGRSNGGVAGRISMASLTLPQTDGEMLWDGQEPTTYVVPLSHPQSPFLGEWVKVIRLIARTMVKYRSQFVNAHAKFDARWVYAVTSKITPGADGGLVWEPGVNLMPLISWDTKSSSHLIDETLSTKLKERVPMTFGIDRWDDHDLSYPGASEDVDFWELGEYACIAEGQKVLTHLGAVPIEEVTTGHLLWDGVEWVSHEGVIFKGTLPVLELDNGLTGTSDHLILTEQGDYSCLGAVKAGIRRAASPESAAARGGLLDPDRTYVAGETSPSCGGDLRPLRKGLGKAHERPPARKVGMRVPVGGEVRQRPQGTGTQGSVSRYEAKMHAGNADLQASRGQGHSVQVLVPGGVHSVGLAGATPSELSRGDLRPDRLQRPLRAGEPPAGGLYRAGAEHLAERVCGVHGAAGCQAPSLAPRQDRQARVSAIAGRAGAEAPAGAERRGGTDQAGENHVKVYDILNAGPRSRFTVSGVVVSNCRDTYWTWRLYRAHLRQLFLDPADPWAEPEDSEEVKDARLGRVAKYVTMPTARSLGMIEQQGIRLDVDWSKEALEERKDLAADRMRELASRFDLPLSGASTSSASKWFGELTEKAIAEDELRVTSMTRAGNPQWTKHVLKKQARQGSETAQLILDQRDYEKQAQFLTSWLDKVTPMGFIHAVYNSGSTRTGRLSSQEPNMQQVSKKLKRAFIPRDGHLLADLDYSQLELRVAAFVSRCEPMIAAYHAGQDLHALFAADQLTRRARHTNPAAPMVPIEDVPGDERQKAKAGNFGLLFGQQAFGFRNYADQVYDVDLTEEEAQEVYDGFFRTWEGMHEWHEKVKRDASRRGYAVSPIGRVRNLPNIHDGNEYLRSEAERQAINSPVQGFGSDLMQMAIASILGEMGGMPGVEGAQPVATVHDSVVVEVQEDGWEEIVEQCQERMENLQPFLSKMECEMDVPLKADAIVGRYWADDSISG